MEGNAFSAIQGKALTATEMIGRKNMKNVQSPLTLKSPYYEMNTRVW